MIDAFKSTLEESLMIDLIDSYEELQDTRIKYSSYWHVLEELKVDDAKVFVILTKYDNNNNNNNNTDAQKIDEITKELQLENLLVMSSKTRYGVHKLKTIKKQYSMPQK